jgi:hypothetical protein
MTKIIRLLVAPNAGWGNKAGAVFVLASLLLMSFVPHLAEAIPSPQPGGGGIVLRVRLADGSMERIQLEEGSEETLTLGDVLKSLGVPPGASVQIGTTTTKSEEKNLKALEIKHGSLITVLPPPSTSKPESRITARKHIAATKEWDPYPDLAKDYEAVMLKTKTKRSSGRGMSYSDISKLQSSLHVVDPQKEGPLLRVYMCKVSAERFYSNGVVVTKKKSNPTKPSFESRFGLLLGTIQRERVDRKPKKARTSLSSAPSNSEYCTVAKVQAVWEPPGQKPNGDGKIYDASMAASFLAKNPRVLAIAKCLGLAPVGWIFSYQDDRLQEENSFKTDGPQALFGLDVAMGGKLKIEAMKEKHDSQQQRKPEDSEGESSNTSGSDDDDTDRGDKFLTLAMDATTGATEAFQLSDVSVQMVHEDMFRALLEPLDVVTADANKQPLTLLKIKNPPMVPMKHPVLVDGKETKVLDSVLCMVNTAVLSHVGAYSGSSSGSATKKSNGGLTNKTKKMLIRALDSSDSNDFLKEICNFNILLALDELLASSASSKAEKATNNAGAYVITDDTKALCKLVKKWARGQKKGTAIDPKFRMKLKTHLS